MGEMLKMLCLSPVLRMRYLWQKLAKYSWLDLLSFGCPLLLLPALIDRPPKAAAATLVRSRRIPGLLFEHVENISWDAINLQQALRIYAIVDRVRSSELAVRSSTYYLLLTKYCSIMRVNE